ncbi:MAG: superoxide dismutase family protein [Rickettsiales bacterium]
MKKILAFSVLAALSAPVQAEVPSRVPVTSPVAKAILKNVEGEAIGTAVFTQAPTGVLIRITAEKLPPGKHGLHIHTSGVCDHEGHFDKAGGHLALEDETHGLLSTKPHVGDLPNLMVEKDGKVEAEFFNSRVSLHESGTLPAILDKDGASLMIHAKADDYATQPTGDSGDRIACGVIK